MVFHVFKYNYNIIYVEGEKKMVAEQLLQQEDYKWDYGYPYKIPAPRIYIGEFVNKESIYHQFKGMFIDGFKYESYLSFIKSKGLVNLMTFYWDSVIEKQILEKNFYLKHKT
jgi:hypothetical protein